MQTRTRLNPIEQSHLHGMMDIRIATRQRETGEDWSRKPEEDTAVQRLIRASLRHCGSLAKSTSGSKLVSMMMELAIGIERVSVAHSMFFPGTWKLGQVGTHDDARLQQAAMCICPPSMYSGNQWIRTLAPSACPATVCNCSLPATSTQKMHSF